MLRPSAAVRRLARRFKSTSGPEVVELPWGMPLEVETGEFLGDVISDCGIYDMPVVEAIFRLVGPTDRVLDFGANIGYMSAAAVAAGAATVVSFEPHPALYKLLAHNASLWVEKRRDLDGRIVVRNQAISYENGVATLRVPDSFAKNHGVASLEREARDGISFREVEVQTTTISEVLKNYPGPIGLLKVDIEGHELSAFKASRDSLRSGSIRDIIFEDYGGFDSEVAKLLRASGYVLFGLNRTPFGPVLLDERAYSSWFFTACRSHNFLATRNPERARERMASRGFRCLRPTAIAA